MKNQTEKDTDETGFWERLTRTRLKKFLKAVISKLLTELGETIIGPAGILKHQGIIDILIVDSTIFTLWDGASDKFPGVKTTVGIWLHVCFNSLTGNLRGLK